MCTSQKGFSTQTVQRKGSITYHRDPAAIGFELPKSEPIWTSSQTMVSPLSFRYPSHTTLAYMTQRLTTYTNRKYSRRRNHITRHTQIHCTHHVVHTEILIRNYDVCHNTEGEDRDE